MKTRLAKEINIREQLDAQAKKSWIYLPPPPPNKVRPRALRRGRVVILMKGGIYCEQGA
jgi:hypothetical protein